MAEEPVWSEPVSPPQIPCLTGKIQGISRFGSLFRCSNGLRTPDNPRVSAANSLNNRTGNVRSGTGNNFSASGNLTGGTAKPVRDPIWPASDATVRLYARAGLSPAKGPSSLPRVSAAGFLLSARCKPSTAGGCSAGRRPGGWLADSPICFLILARQSSIFNLLGQDPGRAIEDFEGRLSQAARCR